MSNRTIRHKSPAGARFFEDVGAGEFYVGKTGVTVSDPRIRQSIMGEIDQQVEPDCTYEPWLNDSHKVVNALARQSLVLVEGDLGAGKSTVIYGARSLLREEGQPYVHIDGHFLNRAARHGAAIRSANAHDRVVIVDSFDYAFLKQSINSKARPAREVWLPALEEHRTNGGKVIVTSHTDPWLRAKTHPDALKMMMDTVSDNAEVLRVGGTIDAIALARLAETIYNDTFAARYLLLAIDAPCTAYTYRVMKQVGLRLGDSLENVTQDSFNTAVEEIDAETRKKMCVDEDYDFC